MLGQDEFAEIIAPIVAYCVDDMDDALASIYYAKLKDLTPGAFSAAVDHWLATSPKRYIPAINDLREIALEYQHGRRMHWQEAWNRILEAADVFSQHDRKRAERAHQIVGPELFEYVRGLGGFLAIMEASGTTLSVKMALFRDAYQRIEKEKIEQRNLPEGMKIPHKVIVQHVATKLGLPSPNRQKDGTE